MYLEHRRKLRDILPRVRRPGRYVGGEWNQSLKNKYKVSLVLAYPDVYEVGMSNLGLQILYEIVNAREDYCCERVFAPWTDMEEEMRATSLPLISLESRRPVNSFDILGFSLQYELTFTNVLNMIELAGIPRFSNERLDHPLVIAGGPCCFNPEPMAPFIDLFVIGEAEEAIVEILDIVAGHKNQPGMPTDRRSLLLSLAKIECVYIPNLYKWDGSYPLLDAGEKPVRVKKRVITEFDKTSIPKRPLVPYLETIHDRCVIEVMRGCTRGCRFCQAGVIYRPTRERQAKTVINGAITQIKNTGHEEISLASLSTTDHSEIMPILRKLASVSKSPGFAVSLPSMRTDRFSVKLAEQIAGIKKTGLTFAPEAGTDRLRRVINKGLTNEEILATATRALKAGWRKLKLYFMIGLPSETDRDVIGISELVMAILALAREEIGAKATRRLKLSVSVSSFVPKAHSPFQWVEALSPSEVKRRQKLLRETLRARQIDLKWHHAESSLLEAAIARGGRDIAGAIELAYEGGARFDGWIENFSFSIWQSAFDKAGLDIYKEGTVARCLKKSTPWDHIECGVTKKWLEEEYVKALLGKETEDCRGGTCSLCGVCKGDIKMEITG